MLTLVLNKALLERQVPSSRLLTSKASTFVLVKQALVFNEAPALLEWQVLSLLALLVQKYKY